MKLKVQGKLYALAGTLLACLALVGALAISNLGAVHRLGGSMYDDRVVPLVQLGQSRALLGDIDSQIQRNISDPEGAARYRRISDEDAAGIDEQMQAYESTELVAAEERGLASYHPRWDAYRKAYRAVLDAAARGDVESAKKHYFAAAAPLYGKVDADLAALGRVNQSEAKALNADIAGKYRSSRAVTLVVLLLALVAGAGLAFLVARGIKTGVSQLLARFRRLHEEDLTALGEGLGAVAQGDLTVAVDPVTEPIGTYGFDEIGDLSRTFDAMLEQIHGGLESYNEMRRELGVVMSEVARGAGTVSSASVQMASTSDETGRAVGEIASAVGDVALGAERQVRMVESTRTAVQEAARVAGTSAETARVTAAAATTAGEAAQAGVKAASSATDAIRQVAESSAQVDRAIRDLSDRSERIGGIVTTISGIAEQTNLLALNAAIEAARAGDQGRGFAVVAEEVRTLAEESQGAAGQIAALVAEIQGQTRQVVEVVAEGTRRTQEGVVTVEQAREAFAHIGSVVSEMSERVSDIVVAVQQIAGEAERAESDIAEVASVAEQSSASAEEVSASTEQTSASAQEIAASAQSLAVTATELDALVKRFKVAA
ncbi:MAG: methyl-accepting chemotaxis protein [Thermoleophilia bacterium]|nr:methyl-accepting chemotaxis protein [Thermoleophilia bacterium]